MKKRFLAIMLALAMSLALLPGAAFAADEFQDYDMWNGIMIKYNGPGGDVVVPEGITQIFSDVFAGRQDIDRVVLPEGLVSLSGAFKNSSIREVVLPNSLRYIYGDTFQGCEQLQSVAIPGSVAVIAANAFRGCTSLSQVTIPDTVAYVSDIAFRDCPLADPMGAFPVEEREGGFQVQGTRLVKYTGPGGDVAVPEGVTTIGYKAFYNNGALTALTLPSTVTSIGTQAFSGCKNLRELHLNEGLTEIEMYAFSGCTSLMELSLPESLTSLIPTAFYLCDGLERLHVGGNCDMDRPELFDLAAEMGWPNAFSNSPKLSQITFGPKVTRVSGFRDLPALTSIELGPNVVEITGKCFINCPALTTVVLGPKVERIDRACFRHCPNITPIDWPASLKHISCLAFWDSPQVTGIKEYQETPSAYIYCWSHDWVNLGRLANSITPTIQAKADGIVAEAGAVTEREKVDALTRWIMQNLRYRSPDPKDSQTPDAILERGYDKCEGYAILAQAFLISQGLPALYTYSYSANHAWNEVMIDGKWYVFDPQTATVSFYDAEALMKDPKQLYEEGFLLEAHGIPMAQNAEDLPAGPEATPSDWARPEVMKAMMARLVPDNIMARYTGGITRLDFCQMLMRLVEQRTGMTGEAYAASVGKTVGDPFTDTHYPAVRAANALGIVNGTSASTFAPYASITRQEAAAMLMRTAKLLGAKVGGGSGAAFTDAGAFPQWAAEGIAYCSSTVSADGKLVMGGVGGGRFDPAGVYSREQAIITTYRLYTALQ